MKKSIGTWYFYLSILLAAVATIAASFLFGQRMGETRTLRDIKPQIDTIYHTDTLTYPKPLYFDRWIADTMLVAMTDTIRVNDTVYVQLPREVKIYEDSTYRAVVSGYRATLDTISVYQCTTTVREVQQIRKACHWGLGVTAGYGICKNGLSPYVGVGISYNLLNW